MKFRFIAAALLPLFLFTASEKLAAERSAPAPETAEITTTTETTAATTLHTTTTVTTTAATTTAVTSTTPPEPPADLILRGMDTVEAGAEITLEAFITERNVELLDGAAMLDTASLGTLEAEVHYLYEGAEFTQTLQYRVADTTAPHIFRRGEEVQHKRGTEFHLSDYVGFGDNFDRHPVLTCEGEVDAETVGAYPLVATVTDSAGNAVSWNLTVNVTENIPKPADTIPRVDYSDFISRYQGENVRFGIDVSAWQADIDYNAVRDAGCSFVIMRVGSFYNKIKPDDYFHQNLKNAAAAGLDVGVYIYTTDRDADTAREHARWIVSQLDGQQLDLPIVFDWEEFDSFQQYGISIRDLNDVYAAFADEVYQLGYMPMLYGSKNVMEEIWSARSKDLAPVWLAHYTRQTSYTGDFMIWQQSAYGRIPGVDGDVDMDIQYLTQPSE